MSHTNIHVPSYREIQQDREWVLLKAEKEFWEKKAEYMRKELENIGEAVERHGYITVNNGKVRTKLILEEEPQQ